MWEIAYSNSAYIKDNYGFNIRVCKHCNKETKNYVTDNRQVLGNCLQHVTECSCGRLFVTEKLFGL